jgi:hypothetical protein
LETVADNDQGFALWPELKVSFETKQPAIAQQVLLAAVLQADRPQVFQRIIKEGLDCRVILFGQQLILKLEQLPMYGGEGNEPTYTHSLLFVHVCCCKYGEIPITYLMDSIV